MTGNACGPHCGWCNACSASYDAEPPYVCDECGKALDPDFPDEHDDERLCGRCYDRREDARRDEYWERAREEQYFDRR